MSTRSYIGYLLPNGKVRFIYCHCSGYPANNGRTLLENYSTLKSVRELVRLGSCSSIGAHLNPDPDKPHNFSNPQFDVTVAYHRDRGEDWKFVRPGTGSVESYVGKPDFDIEFVYLFKDGKWFVSDHNDPKHRLFPLTERLCSSVSWNKHVGYRYMKKGSEDSSWA